MTSERLRPHLESMRTATIRALSFTEGMTRQEFLDDDKTQAAVAMCITIIGEAARKIAQSSPDFLLEHIDWPWNEMRGMRNRVVHAYDTLDVATMWLTATVALPDLKRLLDELDLRDPS